MYGVVGNTGTLTGHQEVAIGWAEARLHVLTLFIDVACHTLDPLRFNMNTGIDRDVTVIKGITSIQYFLRL